MEQQYFFDKRYNRPFSFDGNLIFSKKKKDSEIRIIEVLIDNLKKYIFVYIGKNNTELYKAEDFRDLIDFFRPIDSLYLEFLKLNCELVFTYNSDNLRKNNKKIFGESYEIYNFRKDNFNILIIKIGDEFISDFIGGLLDHLKFNRLYLSVFLLRRISPSNNLRLFHTLKERSESNMKKLNDFNEGERLYDTGVSSIKNKSCIGIYGSGIINFKSNEYDNCHMIISKSGFYLTLNDAIYFDNNGQRLALLLPESTYTSYFGLNQKYHVIKDDSDNIIHECFKNKKYKEEVIKLKLKVRDLKSNSKTESSFLMEDFCMDFESDPNFFNRDYDGGCGDVREDFFKTISKDNELIPFYSSYPIYTNADLILKKENKGSTFFLLKGLNVLFVIVESKNKNYFYNVLLDRILFNLIENKIVPFTFQELFETGRFLMPNSLEDLMSIKCKQNSSI